MVGSLSSMTLDVKPFKSKRNHNHVGVPFAFWGILTRSKPCLLSGRRVSNTRQQWATNDDRQSAKPSWLPADEIPWQRENVCETDAAFKFWKGMQHAIRGWPDKEIHQGSPTRRSSTHRKWPHREQWRPCAKGRPAAVGPALDGNTHCFPPWLFTVWVRSYTDIWPAP